MRQKFLIKRLGKSVLVPPDWKPMRLVEIYSNGNVACVPMACDNYDSEKREYHAESIRSLKCAKSQDESGSDDGWRERLYKKISKSEGWNDGYDEDYWLDNGHTTIEDEEIQCCCHKAWELVLFKAHAILNSAGSLDRLGFASDIIVISMNNLKGVEK